MYLLLLQDKGIHQTMHGLLFSCSLWWEEDFEEDHWRKRLGKDFLEEVFEEECGFFGGCLKEDFEQIQQQQQQQQHNNNKKQQQQQTTNLKVKLVGIRHYSIFSNSHQ